MIMRNIGKATGILRDGYVDIECFGVTDVGRKRHVNQDQFIIGDLHKHLATDQSSVDMGVTCSYGNVMGKILLVADGIGGATAGEVASELAIKSVVEYLLSSMHWLSYPSEQEIERFIEDLKEAACFSHFMVRSDAQKQPARRGMGSTLTVAYINWPMMYVLHIGDSRCYLLRDSDLRLLTKDQTFAQQLYDEGILSQEQFEQSSYHNVLVSAIGAQGEPDALVYQQKLQYGDRVLLCSDGVNVHLDDQKIGIRLSASDSSQAICRQLVADANDAGGQDNITAVVAKFRRPNPV